MSLFNISYPQVIFKQASEPNPVEGGLWYDTDATILYFSDGSSWIELTDSTNNPNLQMLGELSLQVLYLTADAALANPDYSAMFGDVFSDSGGFNNTINTGSTTAMFSTDVYTNAGTQSDAHGVTFDASGSTTDQTGFKINTNNACNLISVTKSPTCTATKAKIYSGQPTTGLIDTATFSGDVATFSSPVALTDETDYHVVVDKDGASYTWHADTSVAGYPYTATNLDFTGSWHNGADTTTAFSIVSLQTSGTPANKVVVTNEITLDDNAVSYMVVALNKSTAGTGSITYDVTFGAGAPQTGKQLNTLYTNTDAGNPVITLKLNGVGAGNTSQMGDYVLIVSY